MKVQDDIAAIMGSLNTSERILVMIDALEIVLKAGTRQGRDGATIFDVDAACRSLDHVSIEGTPLENKAGLILAALMQDAVRRALSYPFIPELAENHRDQITFASYDGSGYDVTGVESADDTLTNPSIK